MNSAKTSLNTSFSLKLVGTILILASLLDYIILAIPFRYQEEQWLIGFIGQIVDRGIIPMIGIIFILIAYWIESNVGSLQTAKKPLFLDLRLPVLMLSSVLGLMFLGLIVIYLNSLKVLSSEAIAQIEEQATAANEQLEQLNVFLDDPRELDQQIKQLDLTLQTRQFEGQTLNNRQLSIVERRQEFFQSLRGNPDAAAKRVKERQTELLNNKKEREERAKTEVLKRSVRIGLSSLMLGVVYTAIGWLGLKGLVFSGSQR